MMPRYIDADVMKKNLEENYVFIGFADLLNDIIEVIDTQPTADVVEVVRCKDCKHYEWADNRAFGMPTKYCSWTGFEDVDDNDFCSRGERREDDTLH